MMKSAILFAATATAIDHVTLNNGVVMPVFAAGTWKYSGDQAEKSVSTAFSVGIRHIDTAHDYCDDPSQQLCTSKSNQIGIARAVRASGLRRDEMFITTKVPGCGAQGTSIERCGADSVAAHENNLKQLGMDYVDLLLVHFPPQGCNCPAIKQQWDALSVMVAQNKTRALGVSNYCQSCIECLKDSAIVPAVNQVQYHIGMGPDPQGLLSYCKQKGIVVEAYSPLGLDKTKKVTSALTESIGLAHNKSSVQVALKFVWQSGVPVISKSSNPDHLTEDADLFDWQLTNDEFSKLTALTYPDGNPSFICTSR